MVTREGKITVEDVIDSPVEQFGRDPELRVRVLKRAAAAAALRAMRNGDHAQVVLTYIRGVESQMKVRAETEEQLVALLTEIALTAWPDLNLSLSPIEIADKIAQGDDDDLPF